MLRGTTICSVVLAIVSGAALAHAQQAVTEPTPQDRIVALDPRWTREFDRSPVAPPGFDEQFAYVALDTELVAIDLDTGARGWTQPVATTEPPATGDGLVFVTGDGEVLALEQRSGSIVWRTRTGASLAGRVYWDAGTLFASTDAGELLAIAADTGAIRWRAALGAPLTAAPDVSGDRLHAPLRDQRLAAIDLEDGVVAWTIRLEAAITGVLALDDQLLAGTRANRLHSIALENGRIRWTQTVGADIAGAPLADHRFIFFVALDNVLRALDRGNGHLRWRRNLPTRPRAGPILAGTAVLVPFVTTDVGAYEAATGADAFTIRAVGELGGTPFIRDQARPTAPRLIVVDREGALEGFAPRYEPPPQPLAELPGGRVGS